ncbi:MAG: hypothetical protein HKP30_15390 [Myxococcales bacterium]|nr:hypothetical protein [Myxococcales bacterium]
MGFGWGSRDAAAGRVGVAVGADGFALVHAIDTDDKPVLEVCEFVSCDGEDEVALALSGRVKEHGLEGLPATAILAPDAYVMRTIPAPEVPEEELAEASRWAMRDLIDFDPMDAVVDVTPIPAMASDATARLFAVAAREARVDRLVDLVRESGLEPEAVEIGETALLNLGPLLGEVSEGQAFLHLAPKRSLFGVVRDGALCMARDLVTDLSVLDSDPEAVDSLFENVLLEVQRSLDYFESNFGRVPAQRLWILPSQLELEGMVHFLDENAPIPVSALDLSRLVDSRTALPQPLQDHALAAFAAAVRAPGVSHFQMWNPTLAAPPVLLSGRTLLKGSGLFTAGLVAVSLIGAWQNGRTQATVAGIEAQLAAEESRVSLGEARGARGPDQALAAEIAALRSERARKTRVLDALSGGNLGNLAGFSPALEALARKRTPNVWLDRITLRDGGRSIALAGAATAPEEVPSWLSSLSGEPFFERKSFQAFELGPPAAGEPGVRFSIDSERAEDAS